MNHRSKLYLAGMLLSAVAPCARAEFIIFTGKVLVDDGGTLPKMVAVQRTCYGLDHSLREGTASSKTGYYTVRLDVADFGGVFSGGVNGTGFLPCVLEAVADGYRSTKIDISDRRLTMNPRLPDITLTRVLPGALFDTHGMGGVPHSASKPWGLAMKAMEAQDWKTAEAPLRAVSEAAPQFAPGWSALGAAYGHLGKTQESRQALEKAIQLDPKPLPPYLLLAEAQLEMRDWDAASKTTEAAIQADTKKQYLETYLQNAVARYQSKDFDGALARVNEMVKLDKWRRYPRTEYILSLILEARKEYDAAGEHMRAYLREHPKGKDAAAVSERLTNLGKAPPADLSAELTPADLRLPAAGEAPVPGGLKAFAQIARMSEVSNYQDFFLQYCRGIASFDAKHSSPTVEAREAIRALIEAVSELEPLGRHEEDRVVLKLSLENDAERRKTEKVLGLFGWRLREDTGGFSLQPGDQKADGLRQRLPSAFGIDELALSDAITAKRPFQFEIPLESARLVGGAAWNVVLKGVPGFTGGPAEIFVRDWRFARVYAGLASMEGEAAGTVVSGVGLPNLINNYSPALADYGEALALDGKSVAVPGGEKAHPVWSKLAGANPKEPPKFFRALFEKDQGKLLAFYFDLSHADAAHQEYFTASAARAESIYKWYRESAAQAPLARGADRWQSVILQKLPLDGDAEAVSGRASLEPLAAVLQLESKRGAPLDRESKALLTDRFGEWRSLFPYFEKLRGLSAADFGALAAFADETAKMAPARQAVLLGEWHSLVKLIALAAQAGSMDAATAARAFRQICDVLHSANPSAGAISLLRELAGSDDVDDAIPAKLLRLGPARREAFEQVKELQGVPSITSLRGSLEAGKVLSALSGQVYAAVLDPHYLLVSEDHALLGRHSFISSSREKGTGIFQDSAVVFGNAPPGSSFLGGFGRFEEVARQLDRAIFGGALDPLSAAEMPSLESPGPNTDPAKREAAPHISDTIFRATGRVVEVYATVTDRRGHYVDDLKPSDFTILEEGTKRQGLEFENRMNSVTVALLFDTTGSMDATLPSLKAAALQLIGDLRPEDSVGVYGFNDRVTEFQSFTTDKTAARRAVLRAHAQGTTALYDALLRVDHDLAQRTGKKVIIVFTDGDDNASMLTAESAILRAKGRGIPIYTIAEGEALSRPKLVEQLAGMSHATGGTPFLIRKVSDIDGVFHKMSEDLMHGYLLVFQPEPGESHGWRKIEVVLANGKGLSVRAREGYYPE